MEEPKVSLLVRCFNNEGTVARSLDSALAQAYLGWSYFGLKDAESFKKYAGKARSLGWKDPQLLERLKRVESGEPIK